MSEADDKSLSHSNGAAKNYGTVTTRVSPGGYLEHKVEKTDTLQGIALKYGTTVRRVPRYCPSVSSIVYCYEYVPCLSQQVEIIRRVNKLHCTGMLHLMDNILIPCQGSLLSSGSYRGSPDHFQRISNAEHDQQHVEQVKSVDAILKSADHQLKLSHTFAQKLARR